MVLHAKNWGRNKEIADVIIWIPLADALSWRRKHDPKISNEEAFNELRNVCSPTHAMDGEQWLVWASGNESGWRPMLGWRSANLPEYRPLENPDHPLVHHPDARPIPASEWPDLALSAAEENAAGNLDYARERTPAWADVHFPRDELIAVWLPLIESRHWANVGAVM